MTTGIRVGANASETRFALVPETAWGVTPTSPTFQVMRLTSETLEPAKETTQSDEFRPDRNVTDEILIGRAVAGELAFELSDGMFETLMESALYSSWGGSPTDTLKNGAGLGTSFTGERTILLPSGSYRYIRFPGLVANTFNLNIQAGQKVTGSFGLMGKFGGTGAATLSGATYTAAPTAGIMNAANQFASLSVSGLSPAPRVMSITLQATNNLRQQKELGNLDPAGFGNGRFVVTGSMQCYFESGDLYDAFMNHTDLALQFVLGSTSGQRYRITLPTIKTTGNPGATPGGNDQDLVMNVNFKAILDRLTSLACAMQIERNY